MSHFKETKKAVKNEMKEARKSTDFDHAVYNKVKDWSPNERKTNKRICKAEIAKISSQNTQFLSTIIFAILSIINPIIVLLLNFSWSFGPDKTTVMYAVYIALTYLVIVAIVVIILTSKDCYIKKNTYFLTSILACIEDVEKELGEQ